LKPPFRNSFSRGSTPIPEKKDRQLLRRPRQLFDSFSFGSLLVIMVWNRFLLAKLCSFLNNLSNTSRSDTMVRFAYNP
jgi:hypothetical protein